MRRTSLSRFVARAGREGVGIGRTKHILPLQSFMREGVGIGKTKHVVLLQSCVGKRGELACTLRPRAFVQQGVRSAWSGATWNEQNDLNKVNFNVDPSH
jgi:hypothetical protein